VGWKIGQPAFWQVSWTGGRTYKGVARRLPRRPARRGNRRVSL